MTKPNKGNVNVYKQCLALVWPIGRVFMYCDQHVLMVPHAPHMLMDYKWTPGHSVEHLAWTLILLHQHEHYVPTEYPKQSTLQHGVMRIL